MGLDMYLLSKLHGEIVYWRKANMIFGYFDKEFGGVDNVTRYCVSKEMLEDLLSKCIECYNYMEKEVENFEEEGNYEVFSDEVIEKLENILPIHEGFFFGNYEYNFLYFSHIQETIQYLSNLLNSYSDKDWEEDEIDFYCWW
jgi:hypothetical protein